MKLSLDKVGVTERFGLNVNQQNFKVTLVGITKDSFVGKWCVEYSPDGIDWVHHEDMCDLTASKTGDLFFNIPYVRLRVTEISAGSIDLHVLQGA